MALDTPILNSFLLLMVGNLGHWLAYAAILGYLIGSIPFGLILTQAAGLGDIRQIGSGNIGATNVLRTGNKGLAAATLVLDGLKATVAVLLANHWYGLAPAVAAGIAAFIGHLYPVWLGFKGGKGVATYIGALLGLVPWAALAFILTWLIVAAWKRTSSLSALAAAALVPLLLVINGRPVLGGVFLLMSLLLAWKHRANISRLRDGSEPEIGAGSSGTVAAT